MGSPADILAVASLPGNDMIVNVEDILLALSTVAVDYLKMMDAQLLPIVLGELSYHRDHLPQVLIGDVEDILVVFLGDDQGMIPADWINIQESINMLIFIDLPGGRSTGDDLAEDAI